jgi:hypothetical protein
MIKVLGPSNAKSYTVQSERRIRAVSSKSQENFDGEVKASRDRLTGLENVLSSARDVAQRLREATVSVGEFSEEELAFVVGLAEDIRDRTISQELLKEARELPVLGGLRVTTHRMVNLGFDAVSVGVKLGSDTFDDFLSPRDQRSPAPAS